MTHTSHIINATSSAVFTILKYAFNAFFCWLNSYKLHTNTDEGLLFRTTMKRFCDTRFVCNVVLTLKINTCYFDIELKRVR